MRKRDERKRIMFGRVPQWNERERDGYAALAAVKIQLDVKELFQEAGGRFSSDQQGIRIGLQIRQKLQLNENIFWVASEERSFVVIAVQ